MIARGSCGIAAICISLFIILAEFKNVVSLQFSARWLAFLSYDLLYCYIDGVGEDEYRYCQ